MISGRRAARYLTAALVWVVETTNNLRAWSQWPDGGGWADQPQPLYAAVVYLDRLQRQVEAQRAKKRKC